MGTGTACGYRVGSGDPSRLRVERTSRPGDHEFCSRPLRPTRTAPLGMPLRSAGSRCRTRRGRAQGCCAAWSSRGPRSGSTWTGPGLLVSGASTSPSLRRSTTTRASAQPSPRGRRSTGRTHPRPWSHRVPRSLRVETSARAACWKAGSPRRNRSWRAIGRRPRGCRLVAEGRPRGRWRPSPAPGRPRHRRRRLRSRRCRHPCLSRWCERQARSTTRRGR